MRYDFRALPELYWAIATALAFVLFTELAGLNPEGVSDWRAWGSALGVACFRAIGGAGLDWVRRNMMRQPEEPEEPAIPPTLASIDPALLTDMLADYQRRKEQRARLKAGAEAEAQQRPTMVTFGSGQTPVTRPPEWVEGEAGRG